MPALERLGIQCSVLVDDEPLPEYKVEAKEASAQCFIESKSGQRFKIKFQKIDDSRPAMTDGFDLSVRFWIDGTWAQSISYQHPFRKGGATSEGIRETANSRRPYEFQDINIVDEDDPNCCEDERVIRNLGSIQVKCYRGNIGAATRFQPPSEIIGSKSFNEKSKKARLSNQTNLGDAIPCTDKGFVKFDSIDGDNRPWAEFTFHYRSRTLLELEEGIELHPLHDEQDEEEEIQILEVMKEVKKEDVKPSIKKFEEAEERRSGSKWEG
ncbi:hypothetical protein BT69DRAFT_1318213 [Atractiella rhizophila]|nr:hypothetical protein BT69DRAFT_1318213 [Atractiella rhizophila]